MKHLLFPLATLLLLTIPGNANALLCSPLLGCSCTVSSTPVAFGNISPMGGIATGTGQMTVDCTGVVDIAPLISVKLNRGLYGTYAARQMKSAAGDTLDYNLYDSGGTVLGDGTGATNALLVSGGLLTLGHWSVSTNYSAKATPLVTTKPGAYSDTVTIRIDW